MRLIDADYYCENTCLCNKEKCDKRFCQMYQAPIAYDIDNVIKNLEELAIEFELFGTSNDYVELSHAIDIVKRGGKG